MFLSLVKRRGVPTQLGQLKIVNLTTDDDNLLGEDVNIVRQNKEALLHASKKVGLEIDAEKIKYMLCLVTRLQDKIVI
jgi:hypothetical protein